MSTFDRVAWGLAILALLPAVVVMGGYLIAVGIALSILGLLYGGRYTLRVYEQQNVGKRAGRFDVNQHLQRGTDDGESRWKR